MTMWIFFNSRGGEKMISQKPNLGGSKQKAVLLALLIFLFTSPAMGTSTEDGPDRRLVTMGAAQ